MQKGTIAAVSSVFTGDYAVPQDSWEAAGYAIGIPLAMGAQIITAEAALGAEAIEGLYQGSQRAFGSVTGQLEKWGFFGKNGVESSGLFVNQFPEHEVYSPHTVPIAQLKNINRKWNYVVTSDGKLIVGKGGQFPGGGHIDLANAQPVKAAGEVKIVNGQIKYIDNSSGHYLPSGLSAQQIAEEAFSRLGFDTLNKYIEKEWTEDPTLRNGGVWRPNL